MRRQSFGHFIGNINDRLVSGFLFIDDLNVQVTDILIDMGFKSTLGSHDFVYDWKSKDITPSQVIDFVDQVQMKLKGKNVLLQFATVK